MTLAREWMQNCEASHPTCRMSNRPNFTPTRLIDVGEEKIFHSSIQICLKNKQDLPPNLQYLTLSHCWGGTVPLRLMRSNLTSMMSNIPFSQLPKTFQDAVIVTQKLGVRYIWIDSLCIIQDDAQDWQHESALMADVYRNAMCNISAAQASNSSQGLFLDRDVTFTKPVKARFQTDRRSPVFHDFWAEYIWAWGLETGPLMSRGWVLQERILSRRNLHFRRDQVAWECREDASCEIFPRQLPFKEVPRPLKHKFSRTLFGDERSMREIMEAWDLTVSKYTACSLTYSTDKLIGLGGLASTFNEFLGPRYLAGIWLKNIAYQLCWSGKREKGVSYVAPSWSWAVTKGPVIDALLPIHMPSNVRQIDVLDAAVDLVSHNGFGQVNSGYLKVAGRVAAVKMEYRETWTRNEQRRLTMLLPNSSGQYSATTQSLSLSWDEEDVMDHQRQGHSGGQLLILAVLEHLHAKREHTRAMAGAWQMDNRRAPSTRWLILCPVQNRPGTYQRCGTFVADDADHDRFEDACDWFDRVPGNLPVHSVERGTRYCVTLV
jgi:hypothetical protein